MPNKRVMIFIDGSNFYHATRNSFDRTDVDFSRLIRQLSSPYGDLMRTYYYNSELPADWRDPDAVDGQQRFFDFLRSVPLMDLRLCRMERVTHDDASVAYAEKEVDVRLAVDMVYYAMRDLFDIAILISGDGDFRYAIDYVKDMGKHVYLAYPPLGPGVQFKSIRQSSDLYIELTRDKMPWLNHGA